MNNVPHSHLANSQVSTSKTLLARCMASENITVIRDRKSSKPYFDSEKRILGLPLWNEMSNNIESMFLAQQVGRALRTPVLDLSELSKGKEPFYLDALAIVEEFRIDSWMKKRFPGLSRNYREGTKELLQRGFFGPKDEAGDPLLDGSYKDEDQEEIDPKSFLNRLLLRTKVSNYVGQKIPFSDEELQLVYSTEEVKTFEEVLETVEDIYQYLVKKRDEEGVPPPEETPGESPDDKDGNQNDEHEEDNQDDEDSNDSEGDGHQDGSSGSDDDKDEDSDEDSSGSSGDDSSDQDPDESEDDSEDQGKSGNEEDGDHSEDSAEADQQWGRSDLLNGLNEQLAELSGQESSSLGVERKKIPPGVQHESFDVTNLKSFPYILYYTESTLDIFSRFYGRMSSESRQKIDEDLKKFMSRTTKIVNSMVQEFMMRKAARTSVKTAVSRSGSLDTSKLYSYRYAEDIFKSHEIKKKGKSHGMLLFFDMSGSMLNRFMPTVLQLFNLVLFCKTAKIPFEVFGFTHNGPLRYIENDHYKAHRFSRRDDPKQVVDCSLTLNNYFSSRMSQSEIYFAMKGLLSFAALLGSHQFARTNEAAGPHALGGTPLNSCIVVTKDIFWRFRAEHGLDVVHSIYLTDGDSTPEILRSTGNHTNYVTKCILKNGPLTYDYDGDEGSSSTATVLELLRDETDSRIICFFLCEKTSEMKECFDYKRFVDPDANLRFETHRKFNRDGYVEIPSSYDKLFITNPSLLSLMDNTTDLREQARARPLLQSFIKMIAE